MTRRKLVLGAICAISLLIILFWIPWAKLRYHGDGTFSEGLLFRPRYVVHFSDIPLYQSGEHHFHFRGLPSEEMTLVLYVKDSRVDTFADRVPLENLETTIEATLKDEKGNVACHALGRPGAGNRDGIWVLMSGGEAGYWHYQCNPIQVFPDRRYDLMIRISDVGAQVEKVVVRPTLYGGGIELP